MTTGIQINGSEWKFTKKSQENNLESTECAMFCSSEGAHLDGRCCEMQRKIMTSPTESPFIHVFLTDFLRHVFYLFFYRVFEVITYLYNIQTTRCNTSSA